MANLGSDNTPIEGESFGLPSGYSFDEENGDLVIRDTDGTVAMRRADGTWELESDLALNENDISGVGAFDSESVNTNSIAIERLSDMARADVDQTVPDDAFTQISFDSYAESQNDLDGWDFSTNTFTAPENGKYRVKFAISWQSDTDDVVIDAGGFSNDNLMRFDMPAREKFTESYFTQLNEGDTIDFEVRQQSGADRDLRSSNFGLNAEVTKLG